MSNERGIPARGHERTSFISGLEESVARFAEKNAEKSDDRGTQKSESSRSATDTAADYECIVRRINNGRTTGDIAKPIVPSTSVFFFILFLTESETRVWPLTIFRREIE